MVEEVAFEGGGKGGSSKSAFGGGGRVKGSWDGTLEPKGRDPRKFSLGGLKSAFWFKMAFPDKFQVKNTTLELFSAPVSKNEKCLFAPGSRLYNSRFFLKDSHQKSIFSKPYTVNPRGHPPNFMDFLPTNSSR